MAYGLSDKDIKALLRTSQEKHKEKCWMCGKTYRVAKSNASNEYLHCSRACELAWYEALAGTGKGLAL